MSRTIANPANRVDRLRRIDRYIGVPLCFALTLIARFLRHTPPPIPVEPRRLLFIKLSEVGSFVFLAPMLRRVHEKWPECELSFLTFLESEETLRVFGLVPDAAILTVDTGSVFRFPTTTTQALARIRRMPIDTVVDLEFRQRSRRRARRAYNHAGVRFRSVHRPDERDGSSRAPGAHGNCHSPRDQ